LQIDLRDRVLYAPTKLLLSRTALASSIPRRFIPALRQSLFRSGILMVAQHCSSVQSAVSENRIVFAEPDANDPIQRGGIGGE
jgi:hypothetical protein